MAALIFWKYIRASELKDVGELFSGNSCLVQMYKSNRTIKKLLSSRDQPFIDLMLVV